MKPTFEGEQDLGLSCSFYSKSRLFPSSFWPVHSKEIEVIAELDNLFFPFPWSKKAWLELVENADSHILITLKDRNSDCIAFSLWKISELEGLVHLLKVLIIPDWRGKALGKSFLQSSLAFFVKNGLFRFYLEVEDNNVSAIRTYESLGFGKLHKALNYYGAGRSAVKMGKFLE